MVTRRLASRRLLGTAVGLLADRVLGEPPDAVHPVAMFGRLMTRAEHHLYRDDQAVGAAYAVAGAATGFAAGAAAGSTALAVGVSASGRMLRTTAHEVATALDHGDVDGARILLPALVGRDPSALDEDGIAAAVVESLAENTVDAVVAPALLGATLGAPGVTAHRAVNTLDAMVGHRSPRYHRFGWAAARLDDAAAFLPARLTATLVGLSRPARARQVLDAVRRDAPAHPSPNAGVAEAAFAAALGLELGGTTRYPDRVEHRPRLGRGPRPVVADIGRAAMLASQVEWTLVGIAAGLGIALTPRRRR